jgi:hypothetical protein
MRIHRLNRAAGRLAVLEVLVVLARAGAPAG